MTISENPYARTIRIAAAVVIAEVFGQIAVANINDVAPLTGRVVGLGSDEGSQEKQKKVFHLKFGDKFKCIDVFGIRMTSWGRDTISTPFCV